MPSCCTETDSGRPGAETLPQLAIDKAQIAHSFSRAAGSYDTMAALQRRIGHELLRRMPAQGVGCSLDLGCGTGYFSQALISRSGQQRVIGLDLAQGMLRYASDQRDHAGIDWLCADAERLPLADNSVDQIFSSLAIQWCEDPQRLFNELLRVLKPGGLLAVATLGPHTLAELRNAWSAVDNYPHVNHFTPLPELAAALTSRFTRVDLQESEIVLRYERVKQLTDELKGIGAHNLNTGRLTGLSGRRRIQAFLAAYEAFRDDDGLLPATYQVFYALAQKP